MENFLIRAVLTMSMQFCATNKNHFKQKSDVSE